MLSVARLRNTKDERHGEKIESSFYMGGGNDINDFPDFSTDNLLDSIDFDDLFVGMENEVDVLPDLEMDTDILGDFSVSGGEEESECVKYNTASGSSENIPVENCKSGSSALEEIKVSDSGSGTWSLNQGGEEILSKRDSKSNSSAKGAAAEKEKKSAKNQQGKRKVKVDWTPELHRRFVQVVEQLGVDKAVPSRILELMGIDCLTRHNIASHLQKYRSHRKHLLAREAEAASWSQRRQIYNGGVALAGCKREMVNNPNWFTPTMGFPPVAPMPHHFRPLHVWGHPSMDQRHIWPKHNFPPNSRPPVLWPAPAAPQSSHLQQVPNPMSHGTPCFQPPPPTPTNFLAPPAVRGLLPHAMYKVDDIAGVPSTPQACPHPPIDFHPSKESIDAALEDVLTKPWLPLPLGLKPPSTDSVVVELHRQGIEKIPPATCG